MSEFSGVLSLIFIVAAFLTSCNEQQPAQGISPPAFHYLAE
jgi:hypothetical protein